jgi:tRNA A-37 threonylcarbamoyl transferase component Bud32
MQMAPYEVNVLTMLGNDTGCTPVFIFTSASMIVGCNPYHVIITVLEEEPILNLITISHKLITDASNALRYLRHRGILHGDTGMSNIIVSSAGVVKLIDFGLSQSTNSSLQCQLRWMP